MKPLGRRNFWVSAAYTNTVRISCLAGGGENSSMVSLNRYVFMSTVPECVPQRIHSGPSAHRRAHGDRAHSYALGAAAADQYDSERFCTRNSRVHHLYWIMRKRDCTCGAEGDVRRGTRRTLDGRDEIVYRMVCPVCGQLGPAITAAGKDEATAIAEAVAAWNEMIARCRPLED
jgi:hypothetical protein